MSPDHDKTICLLFYRKDGHHLKKILCFMIKINCNFFIIIKIIIIKNVKIRVTLSWVTLQGHFTELLKSQTKWSAAGEWSQCRASVSSNSHVFKRLRKERSDGASLTAGGRLFQARAAATGNARSPSVWWTWPPESESQQTGVDVYMYMYRNYLNYSSHRD